MTFKPTPKKMGLLMLSSLVCGNMIGSGVFLLPASLARIGSISLLSWIFTGCGALCLAIIFAHMSTLITKTGGPYCYARAILGEFIGFQTAYSYWIAIWVGNAAMAIALVGYLQVFLPALDNPWYTFMTAAGTIWLLTIINVFGVRSAGFVQSTTAILKVIPILLIGLLGWFFVKTANFVDVINISHPALSNFDAVSVGAALTFWAFIGLESATVPADSVEKPKINIPLATLIGTTIAIVVYTTSSSAIMGMIPANKLQHSVSPFADAAKIILGHWGGDFIAIVSVISCFGALNGWVLLQGQIAMAAANDDLFPKLFKQTNQYVVPAKGIVFTSLLITLLLLMTINKDLIEQFNSIILLAVLANIIPYLYTIIAHVLYLRSNALFTSQKKLLLSISALAFFYVFWAIFSSGIKTMAYSSILFFTSVPCYAWIKRQALSKIGHDMITNKNTID